MNTNTSKTGFSSMRRAVLGTLVLGAALASSGTAIAQSKEVTIAYQEINGPFLVAIASGEVEKTTGYKINWRKFDSGAKVATGMASGDVQIGVIGSSPLTAAVSRGVDLQLFWIIDDINEAEAMVARNGAGITKPTDLRGKKIAVPSCPPRTFTPCSRWNVGIKPTEVKLLTCSRTRSPPPGNGATSTPLSCGTRPEQTQAKRQVLVTSAKLSKKARPRLTAWPSSVLGRSERRLHGQVRQSDGRCRRRLPRQSEGVTIDSPQVKATSSIRARLPGRGRFRGPVRLPIAAGAGVASLARWRRQGRRGASLAGHGAIFEGRRQDRHLATDYAKYVTPSYAQAAGLLK